MSSAGVTGSSSVVRWNPQVLAIRGLEKTLKLAQAYVLAQQMLLAINESYLPGRVVVAMADTILGSLRDELGESYLSAVERAGFSPQSLALAISSFDEAKRDALSDFWSNVPHTEFVQAVSLLDYAVRDYKQTYQYNHKHTDGQ